jgi:LAO/AO transport system kinase
MESGWKPQVGLCSARAKSGIAEAWDIIGDYCKLTKDNGYFERKREQQLMDALHETINYQLVSRFYSDPTIALMLKSYKEKMLLSHLSPYAAAQELLQIYHD